MNPPAKTPASDSDTAHEMEMRRAMELLFYAYREFIAGPDHILAKWGFGRAHHRVIYFVGRHPGITVSELLAILRITKQSLARVLGQLVAEGLIDPRPHPADRRRRCLTLTDTGGQLDRALRDIQDRLIDRAYRDAGADGVKGFTDVLMGFLDAKDKARFAVADPEDGPD